MRRHRSHVAMGLLMLIAGLMISPSLVAWMSPTILGLVLAILLSWATGQLSLGIFLRRSGLLGTPEERAKPCIVRRANKLGKILARQVEKAEGLRSLYEDPEFRAVHLAMLPPGRTRKRGEISADWALAEAKLEEAHSIDEAMDWLKPVERMIVMLDPDLIALLAAIPKSPIVPIDTAA